MRESIKLFPINNGGVAEWLKALVLKTRDRLRGPRVRISPPPPIFNFFRAQFFLLKEKGNLSILYFS